MRLEEIRKKFLDYFASFEHQIVASSSLVPINDSTLLFTNAGMNQFKNIFLGIEKSSFNRATSVQKCLRAGGKHNDLENVGYTARHHTFFEMLGNFSFGDYFKVEAIKFAWEFLTKVLLIPTDKLYVTVFIEDDEAYKIWHEIIGLKEDRIIRITKDADGNSDNFWQMGDTGPCGPCTEIFYDHGESVYGGLPGSINANGDRYVEIWNCVFMQYNRDLQGKLHLLPKPSVDTGMGLERITAVLQGVHSNYDIDIFVELIKKIAQITKCKDLNNPSLKVIADHIRAICFLIAEDVLPANEGRGYVLRRIMRRAIRHGFKLGMHNKFLYLLVDPLILQMGEFYSELRIKKNQIETVIIDEEEKFSKTLSNGMELLNNEIQYVVNNILSGKIAFKLYDTYGFPFDIIRDICRENNIEVDEAEFLQLMNVQKHMAKESQKFKIKGLLDYQGCETKFLGYLQAQTAANIVMLYNNNQIVDTLNTADYGIIVLDQTVCYPESGGQIGDIGTITVDNSESCIFEITDTQYIRPNVIGHIGKILSGKIKLSDKVIVKYDLNTRLAIQRNHSATHLLHKALQEVLGIHATQKGSLVTAYSTRFDFMHNTSLTELQKTTIEQIVNDVILKNYSVTVSHMSYKQAIDKGVTALFDEKYADIVSVINMGEFSKELCGGTHVARTGDIGLFKIISEVGIANGIRRIEAVTGNNSFLLIQKYNSFLNDLQILLKSNNYELILDKTKHLIETNRELKNQYSQLNLKVLNYEADKLLQNIIILKSNLQVLAIEVENISADSVINLVDILKFKLKSAIIVLGYKQSQQLGFTVAITDDLVNIYKANLIVNYLCQHFNGKGGGKTNLAKCLVESNYTFAEIFSKVNQFIKEIVN